MSFTEMLLFCRVWTWKKFWHTAMNDGATGCVVIIVTSSDYYVFYKKKIIK